MLTFDDKMNKDEIKVGIYGHRGRLGSPLIELLQEHPKTDVVYTQSRSEGEEGSLEDVEVAFLALPPDKSEEYLSDFKDKKVIDLSPDHRCEEGWIYGLPEMNREEIENAKRVANPGCYTTSIVLGLAPLQEELEEVEITAISGISGAGKEPKEEDNFRTYQTGRKHYQIEEIEEQLDIEINSFAPVVSDRTDRGILSRIFARGSFEGVVGKYKEFYEDENFVDVMDGPETEIQTKDVLGTNRCQIGLVQSRGWWTITSVIDNTIKGGSGQAVQNFNLMNGFEEGLSLK